MPHGTQIEIFINFDQYLVHMTQKRFEIIPEIINILVNQGVHGRQIAEMLEAPLSTVQRALKILHDENVIEYKTNGRNKVCRIRKDIQAKRRIIDAELYKLNKLMKKEKWMKPIIKRLTEIDADMVIIFGSYAKGSQMKQSDIDVFIETKEKSLKEQAESINTKINAKIGIMDTRDLLIKEIIQNHVIVKGVERYYERIGFFEKD